MCVYRAADWKLDSPDFTVRMRIVAKGKAVTIKLEDKNSGELFAQCPVEAYPGVAVEAVMDSSRYFVLKLMGDGGKLSFLFSTCSLITVLNAVIDETGAT